MTLKRGFKAAAEREAAHLRTNLGLGATDPLDLAKAAAHLGIKVISAEELVPRAQLEELEQIQAFSFSAATFEIADRKFIVTNPIRSPGRRNSDMAHELAHVLLKHELSEVREVAGVPFRTCRPDEEEEATTFGGTLLLPRSLLLAAAKAQVTPAEIAERYDVTVEMAYYRYNTTGVARQASRIR
ncbi:MAG: ImmA/IrrE family metallo-endopeptidase [Propionibacteriaceae bacterium]